MKRACKVGAMLFILAVPASAQVFETYGGAPERHWELTPTAGGYFGSDIYTVTGASLHLKDSWTYGARLAYYFQRQFALEVAYMYAKSDMESNKILGTNTTYGSFALNQIDFNGNFEGGYKKLYGYFTIGLGMTIVDPKLGSNATGVTANPSSSTKFAFNTGLGIKTWVSDKFGLRIDGRLRTIDTGHTTGAGTWCDIYGCWSYASTWYNSGEVTGGIILRF